MKLLDVSSKYEMYNRENLFVSSVILAFKLNLHAEYFVSSNEPLQLYQHIWASLPFSQNCLKPCFIHCHNHTHAWTHYSLRYICSCESPVLLTPFGWATEWCRRTRKRMNCEQGRPPAGKINVLVTHFALILSSIKAHAHRFFFQITRVVEVVEASRIACRIRPRYWGYNAWLTEPM